MKKNYKLFSSAKQILFAVALIVFSGNALSQATYTFNYTGSSQTLSIPGGNYEIECWGADGGDGGGASPQIGSGGKGGYSKGTYVASGPTTLHIYVGGKGQSNGTTGTGVVTAPGGWNGGGGGFSGTSSSNFKGGGGGGSDVRTTQNTTYANRIIVAGGGGGAGGSTNSGYIGLGGYGGGTLGQNGVLGVSQVAHNGLGGTQSAGGAGGLYSNSNGFAGSFGIGGDGGSVSGNSFPAGGGGGGWYGGGGGATQGGSGGGGSGYIVGLTNAVTSMSTQNGFVPNPVTTGNGLILIKELCSITLFASTTNSLNPAICSGQSVTLTTNGVSNYVWSNGNTTTNSIVVSPASTTVYTLSATSPSVCTAARSITVNVSGSIPVLSVNNSANQTCLGKTATLTASGALTYTWQPNFVTNGVSFNPTVTTTYTVTGENGCGTTTAVSTISVDPLPISIVSTHTAICANKTATLSVTAAATTYTWEPGNIINNNPVLIVNPQVNTIYTVTATDGTCVGVTNVSLQSDPVPTINATASSTVICPGGAVTLSVTGANNYTWTPGNINGNIISVNPSIPTLYNVIGDNAFGCVGSAQQVVVVGTPPTIALTANDYTICNGSSTTLSATGANNFAWTNGPNTSIYAVTPNSTTTYTVIGTDTNNPCSATSTIQITVVTPVLTISGSTTICNGESTNLTASGVTSYTWAHIGTSGAVTNVAPTSNTSYTMNGTETVNNVNCPISGIVSVVVNPKPTVTAVPTRTAMCPKETNTLTAGGASTYSWANTTTVTPANTISFTSTTAGIVIYTLTGVSAQGCEASITVPINVSACTGINELDNNKQQLSIYPNPNNGEFFITTEEEMTLSLINELGQVVKKLDVNSKNNYQVSVSNLPNGIYFVVGEGLNKKIVVSK